MSFKPTIPLLLGSRWPCARYYSSQPPSGNPNSLFSQNDSAWDRMFANLEDYKARSSPSQRDVTPKSPRSRQPSRRQTMTAREINAFDEIFNMIFDAAEKHEASSSCPSESFKVNAFGNMFNSLRLNSRGAKWPTDQDEFLDRRKEEIDLCPSDMELLQWTQREVLDMFATAQHRTEQIPGSTATHEQENVKSKALHIHAYSHLVAYLMCTFRDKYRDPHLALALFDQVRHRSLISYVFGCSTQVYNELLETRWVCFRDLRGVHDALEEMVVNGIALDPRTRRIVEMVRRQAGERNAWVENLDAHNREMWNLLLKLDHLVAKSTLHKKVSRWDQWKKQPLDDKNEDEWGFGQWSKVAQG